MGVGPPEGAVRLRPVGIADERACLQAHDAFTVESMPFLLHYDVGMPWADYVQRLRDYRCGLGLKPGLVADTFLLATVDGSIVGRTSIRHELNEFLAAYGGHIGYAVLAPHRRRGYATEILRQSLIIARAAGVDWVLVTCDDDNVGSRAVIEACGGVFDEVVQNPNGVVKRRYWIP